MNQDNNFEQQNNNQILNDEIESSLGHQQPTSIIDFKAVEGKYLNTDSKKKSPLIFVIIFVAISVVCGLVFLLLNINNLTNDASGNSILMTKDDFSFLYKDGDTFYYIDEKGKIYAYSGYENIEDFKDGYAFFSKKSIGKTVYGIMDKNEKEVVKAGLYNSIEKLDIEGTSNTSYRVRKGSLYGVIDYKGTIIIPTEYESIRVIGLSAIDNVVYLAEKNDKYYYISSSGNVMTETDNYGLFTTKINGFLKTKEEADGAVLIDNKNYYNATTGEFLFSEKDNIKFEYNILFEEQNSISLYDQNLKLKEKISTPNTKSIKVHNLKSGYIVLIERIYKDRKSYQKYTLYDQDFNLKKVVEQSNASEIEVEEVGENHFYIKEEYIDFGRKDVTTVYDQGLNEYIMESNDAVYCVINKDGKIIFIETDYENNIVRFYDAEGEKITEIEKHKTNTSYAQGEYIALVQTANSNKFYDIYNFNGELVAEDIKDVNNYGDNDEIKFLYRKNEDGPSVLVNGLELKDKKYNWQICGDNVIAFNATNDNVKIYDNKGKLKKEISAVEKIYTYNEHYIILISNSKYKMYNIQKNKIVFEVDEDLFEYEYSDEGMNIIETKEAFYSFEGKKLLEKNQK